MKKTILLVLVLVLSIVPVSLAAEDTWTTKANMPTARYVLSSSVVDGIIYAIGGDAGSRASVVEAYDPLTDTWTRKANMPMGRGAGTSSVVNGKIYYMGGRLNYNGANISSVIEYDATTDTWTAKADMPTPRTWLSSSVVNGKIYVIGGALTYQGAPLSTVEEYDSTTNTWTTKADMPTPRASVSTNAVNGRIYAIGGTSGYGQWNQGLSTVEEYDPAADTWTRKNDMPTGRTYFSTCVVNGKIYAIGGMDSNHLSSVEEYDPATDTWIRVADIPTARSGLATSAVNGKIYAIGGWVGSGTVLSTVEEYNPNPLMVDFNGDEIVDIEDLIILIESWGQDDTMCDIAPRPFGDGIVDVLDLELLMSYWGQEILPVELIAYWKLDQTEGNIAYNSTGYNDGLCYGEPIWQPDNGQVAGALQFDGIDDYVETGFVIDPADGPFSVFAWIQGGAPGQTILSQVNGRNWLSIDEGIGALTTELTVGLILKPLASQAVIIDGDWHLVGISWNGADLILYVDDVEVARKTQSGMPGSQSGLYIGAGSKLGVDTFFSGLIDDVRIYNRAFSP